MGRTGHFSRTIAKGPDTTTWIRTYMPMLTISIVIPLTWKRFLEKYLVPISSTLHYISLVESGMYFHGARFSNYEAWLSDPTHIGPKCPGGLANSGPRNIEW
ncbi:hypothetical protein IFM89_020410 [Coptis chinensis]|uniref:Uncharacterized protein n=1 Tax=Coptis chinensis TaxID=261450 RepID=A0A835HC28_9MAGN|nr:hypothetical protein IFM89_020410 [Coptis chinensis]